MPVKTIEIQGQPVEIEVKEPKPHIDNTELVKAFSGIGGRVVHFLPSRSRRGLTVAYIRKGNRVMISTAVQHPNDPFEKKVGTRTAIEHFYGGQTVVLPLKSRHENIVDIIEFGLWG